MKSKLCNSICKAKVHHLSSRWSGVAIMHCSEYLHFIKNCANYVWANKHCKLFLIKCKCCTCSELRTSFCIAVWWIMSVTSCSGKRCIFYSCTTLPITDFHELLPFNQLSDLTTIYIIRPQLKSDHFNPAHDGILS